MPTITTSLLDYWLHKINTYLTECHHKFRISRLDDIIKRHDNIQHRLGQERRGGFVYNGLIWRQSEKPAQWFEHLVSLDKSLEPEMDAYFADEQQAQKDFLRIRQTMVLVLKNCSNNQDLRDALPECLLPAFGPEVSTLPRTREIGFSITSPAIQAQWERAEERINFHCAMRLIYS